MPNRQRLTGLPELDPKRQDQIRRCASWVWRTFCDGGTPDPERIIRRDRRLSLDLCELEGIKPAVTVCLGPSDFVIFLDPRKADPQSPRWRFILAHELGHCFLQEHVDDMVGGSTPFVRGYPVTQREVMADQEASYFASTLLMPDEQFWVAVRDAGESFDGIRKISKEFNVSIEAALIRCVQATRLRCAAVRFLPTGWVYTSVSPLANSDWGLSRQSRLKCLELTTHCSKFRTLKDWFLGLPDEVAAEPVIQRTAPIGKMARFGYVTLLSERGYW